MSDNPPTEAKPAEPGPAEPKPEGEAKPVEAKPAEPKPEGEAKPVEAGPAEPKPEGEAKPVEAKPAEPKPEGEAESGAPAGETETAKEVVAVVPELTKEQIEEISRRVEIPTDQTPPYKPKHVLSKEFGGTSNYEVGLGEVREEAARKLRELMDSGAGSDAVRRAEEDLRKVDCMYENYHIGMNVFRTAKGGRDRAKK